MKTVIFGANGPTGRLAVRCALTAGHAVVAVTRHPREFPITHPQLTVVAADVRNDSAVRAAIAGADAVVSALGVPSPATGSTPIRPERPTSSTPCVRRGRAA